MVYLGFPARVRVVDQNGITAVDIDKFGRNSTSIPATPDLERINKYGGLAVTQVSLSFDLCI